MKVGNTFVWLTCDAQFDSNLYEYVSEFRHFSFERLEGDIVRYEGEFIHYNERDDPDGYVKIRESTKGKYKINSDL